VLLNADKETPPVEYFKISAHCPDLYEEVTKIFEDCGISKNIKVVIEEKISSRPIKDNNFSESRN
tara:strand:+ start:104 stop:298 length:195 start_codon:yes stop_codon:yes gene_type:complete